MGLKCGGGQLNSIMTIRVISNFISSLYQNLYQINIEIYIKFILNLYQKTIN